MSGTEENSGSSEDDRKLFVGGLPQEASENDLKEYFEGYGEVTSTVLKMDQLTGRSRGFAFVVFSSADSLENVLGQEHVVKGKKVACKKATAKQGKVYVGKFTDGSITEEQIKSHFSQYGNVVEIQRPVDRSKDSEPKNFCFVTFDKEEPAERLLKEKKVTLHGQEVEIKKVTIKPELSRGGGGGMGRGRNNAPWGGYDPWSGGYDPSWGYAAPMSTPWAAASYGGNWSGWSSGGGFGGGKLGPGSGGSGYRGGRGGSRGRNAPY